MGEEIKKRFHQEMLDIYKRALTEAKYKPTVFLRMVGEHGGYETARRLIHASSVSEGYVKLFECGRLDLTVEAVIDENQEWHTLFTEEELEICRKRLRDYRYKV